jgi:hypothetical protein
MVADLACLLFGAAAWKVRARDAFIGWSAEQRQERLSLISAIDTKLRLHSKIEGV